MREACSHQRDIPVLYGVERCEPPARDSSAVVAGEDSALAKDGTVHLFALLRFVSKTRTGGGTVWSPPRA